MKQTIIAIVGLVISLTACKKDADTRPAKKVMSQTEVELNGKKIEISKTAGSTPTIVLISGFGSPFSTWQKVFEQTDQNTAVFTFNRPGVGSSESVSGSRDAATIAAEMKTLLDANKVQPPFVLVGHSMGGLYARMFYNMYPQSVKGIVLVDASHENQLDSLLSQIPAPDRDALYASLVVQNDSAVNLMPDGALKEEFRANFATNYAQIKTYGPITQIPLYVLCSTKIDGDNSIEVVNVHRALHQQWARAAGARGKFVETSKSGHYIQEDEPELVNSAISWIMNQ